MDGEGEGLLSVAHGVGGGQAEAVDTGRACRRGSRQGGGAVAVVDEGDPRGSAPVLVMVGVGRAVVVTVKLPAVPTVNVVLAALVNAGDCRTCSVTACGAVPSAFAAVAVKE